MQILKPKLNSSWLRALWQACVIDICNFPLQEKQDATHPWVIKWELFIDLLTELAICYLNDFSLFWDLNIHFIFAVEISFLWLNDSDQLNSICFV